MSLRNRYPGVKPFETVNRDLFFGRNQDTDDLLDLIELEKVVVLFGKSGYGKSSLLNAGILPALEDMIPVVFRFGSYVTEGYNQEYTSPLALVRKKIQEDIKLSPSSSFLNEIDITPSLWLHLKCRQTPKKKRFLLIFDQFEEFFTYPVADQNLFKDQLSELLYAKIPQTVRDKTDKLDHKELSFVANSFDAKVVFAIRWDRLGLLDSLKDKLPAILQKRYELKGLTRNQAKEAIELPAKAEKSSFKTEKFTYSEEALTTILDELTKSTSESQMGHVEAFQLQIICQSIESKVKQTKMNRVTLNDLPDLSDIYASYYNRQIETLELDLRESAQSIIENDLIDIHEERRISVDSRTLLRRSGVTAELLDKLEDTFLIRREKNTVGGFSYEVSHDTLIVPIIMQKQARDFKLKKQNDARTLREAKAQAVKAKKQAAKERFKNQQLNQARMEVWNLKKETKKAQKNALYWRLLAQICIALAASALFWAYAK